MAERQALDHRSLGALGIGTIVGIGAARLVAARLAFHGFDGLLAADALRPSTRRRYGAAWHEVGGPLVAIAMLIVRPSLLIVGVAGYLAGMLVVGLAHRIGMPEPLVRKRKAGWTAQACLHRPAAGIAAAAILLLSLLAV